MTSPIKWAGGKATQIDIICENLPSKFSRYIEPFLGEEVYSWVLSVKEF